MDQKQARESRQIVIGKIAVGGGAPITVQSMTKCDTRNVEATVAEINYLEQCGCDLIRVAVKDMEAATAIRAIKSKTTLPLIADIHFDYRLAISCIDNGIDGLRINPGNIGSRQRIAAVVEKAKERSVPIRIGVNAGSLESSIREKFGISASGLVESALAHVAILEAMKFYDIKISLKAAHVPMMIQAYRDIAQKVDYPLHLGVTEAGTIRMGTIKSAIGIGALLADGIGDTIRVSLTAPPREEVRAAIDILHALGIRSHRPELISCPTCGRCEVDLFKIVEKVETALENMHNPIKVAVMGCVVNGPGEAQQADVGLAAGKGCGIIFSRGKQPKKVSEDDMINALLSEIREITSIKSVLTTGREEE